MSFSCHDLIHWVQLCCNYGMVQQLLLTIKSNLYNYTTINLTVKNNCDTIPHLQHNFILIHLVFLFFSFWSGLRVQPYGSSLKSSSGIGPLFLHFCWYPYLEEILIIHITWHVILIKSHFHIYSVLINTL